MSETLFSCPGCQALILPQSDSCCPLCGAALHCPAEDGQTRLWFYAANREKKGPISWADLQALLRSGSLDPADMVLQAGSRQWQPAQAVPGLTDAGPAPVSAIPLAPSGVISLAAPSAGWGDSVTQPPREAIVKPPSGIPLAADTCLPEIPGYEILAELGRGGMGVVYMARQVQLKRMVALKMILSGYVTAEDRARFRIEAESVARLQNPYIVQIYDIGEHNQLPYFSLEYVSGGSLHDQLDGTPRPGRQAAELVRLLALGMQAAHSAGIVHRDLKPANILLQPASDGAPASAWGVPKISDFGLAKQLDTEARTQTGTVLGTPQYMAPEQARGRVSEVGPCADIYALGAILYEIITGRPPFQGESTMDTLLQVVETEPVAPSRLQPRLPRDLETICMKCLEKDPRRRYPTCAALADDLQRFLNNQPISARPIGWRERTWKWARRRPAVASLLVAVFLVGLAGIIGVLTQWRQAVLARADADAEASRAKAALAKAEQSNYYHRVALGQREWEARRVGRARALLAECPERLRDWEWRYLRRLLHPETAVLDAGAPLLHVTWSPDGRYVASSGEEGVVILWDATSHKELARCRGHTGQVWRVAFSNDSRLLASGGEDQLVRLWEVPSGRLVRTLRGHTGKVHGLSFHPNGKLLATGGGEVFFWDLASGRQVWQLPRGRDRREWVLFHPDGHRLVTAGYHQSLELWDLRTGTCTVVAAHDAPIFGVTYSANGQWLVTCSADRTVALSDAATGRRLATLRGANDAVSNVAFSPDGSRMAAGSTDQSVLVWEIKTGRLLVLRGHTESVHGLAFHRDGRRLVSVGQDGKLRFWDTSVDPEMDVFAADTLVEGVAFSPDSRLLATADWDGAVNVWEYATRKLLHTLKAPNHNRADAVAFSPDGRYLVGGGSNYRDDARPGIVMVWSLESGQLVRSMATSRRPVTDLAISAGGLVIAATGPISPDGQPAPIETWDLETGRPGPVMRGHLGQTSSVACSPDGKVLVSGGADCKVRLWDLSTGEELLSLGGHLEEIQGVAFHPDGQRIASASLDRTIKIWKVAGSLERTLSGHVKGVTCVAFSPDGKRLGSGGSDSRLKIWDVATGHDVLTLQRHTQTIQDIAFSPDGTALATSGHDRRVLLWRAP